MAPKIKTVVVIGAFLSLLWLSACGSSTPTATPTIDLDPFRTEVAATVFAQVTQELALTPSITPIPSATPTTTLTPTPTLPAGACPAPPAGASPAPPISTFPPGTTGVPSIDLAQWVSQSIADDTVFAPGETFTITWRMKNVGTSTWTVAYLFRFYSGNTFGAPTEILLSRIALPGETVDISIPMRAPTQTGNYRTDWVMSNEARSNFKDPVFLKIVVALPLTPTLTETATSAPTSTP
jgi:hypothetical protein